MRRSANAVPYLVLLTGRPSLAFTTTMSAAALVKRARVEDSSALDPVRNTLICSTLEVAGDKQLKIGTHDGKFHCDEALAIAMLKCLPKWKDAAVVRTRDTPTLEACDIVVDVGGRYDPDGTPAVFDHHQKGFEGVLEGYETKLSSAGLVYKHFGREVRTASFTTLRPSSAGPHFQPSASGLVGVPCSSSGLLGACPTGHR